MTSPFDRWTAPWPIRSPAPKPVRFRRWHVWGGALVVASALLGVVCARSGDWTRVRLETVATARLGYPVAIRDLAWRWGEVRLSGVSIGAAGSGIEVELPLVHAVLDTGAFWGRRIALERVVVQGGVARVSTAELERLRTERSGSDPGPDLDPNAEPESAAQGLVQIEGLELHLVDESSATSVDATVRADLGLGDRIVRLALTEVRLAHEPFAPLLVREVRVDLDLRNGPQWPIHAEVHGGAVRLDEHIGLGGVNGWVEVLDRGAQTLALDIGGTFADPDDTEVAPPETWHATGFFRRDRHFGGIRVKVDEFELGRVPAVLARLPLVDSEAAVVGGYLSIALRDGVGYVEGDVGVSGLNVQHATLAPNVVRGVSFGTAFGSDVDLLNLRVDVHYADIERQGLQAMLRGEFEIPERRDGRRYTAEIAVPSVPCSVALSALPADLLPALVGFELRGDVQASVELEADMGDLDNLHLGGSVGIRSCRVRTSPPHAAVDRLGRGFEHRVLMRDGQTRVVQMYSGSGSFATLDHISPYMVQAVLTTEDGGFWKHRGFLSSQFEVAMRRNLEKGRIELGASTITMQMVKNVLLSQERTLARKLQEMFLTWYVESTLEKNRILELYLNGIEYGPGVYGIVQAARHYFGKHPMDLDPPEAVFLALMLPNPVDRHTQYCRGEVSETYQAKVQHILTLMNERERLTNLEYAIWKDVPVMFDLADRESESSCLAEIRRVDAGRFTQRALSGLLASPAEAIDTGT